MLPIEKVRLLRRGRLSFLPAIDLIWQRQSTFFFLALLLFFVGASTYSVTVGAEVATDGYAALRDGDYKKAYRFWLPLAKKGDAIAQYNLGWMHEHGKGVQKSIKQSLQWYTKSAVQGDIDAQYMLATKYGEGQFVQRDFEASRKWLRQLTEQANYQRLRTIQSEAENGKAYAQFALGFVYENGFGVDVDYIEAAEWYQAAANQSLVPAFFRLGSLYQDGKGVMGNHQEALRWYKMSESHGVLRAQLEIGKLYHYGEDFVRNYEEAMLWYKKAGANGNSYARLNIGELYFYGQGVKKDYQRAFQWIDKAFRINNPELVKTIKERANKGGIYQQVVLGDLHRKGKGVQKDTKAAFQWTLKAAEQGDIFAQRMVGMAYENGNGVGKDLKKAQEWYQTAVTQGDRDSELHLKRIEAEIAAQRLADKRAADKKAADKKAADKKAAEKKAAEKKAADKKAADKKAADKRAADKKAADKRAADKKADEQKRKGQCPSIPSRSSGLRPIAFGSGFIINKYGKAVTNFHVTHIEDRLRCKALTTVLNGRERGARYLFGDEDKDLAVIDTCRESRSPAFFRGGQQIGPGGMVFALGFPYADELGVKLDISDGMIRKFEQWEVVELAIVTAAINPGNSGGPIVDQSGNVVAVAVAQMDKEKFERAENINFGISTSEAISFLKRNDVRYNERNSVRERNTQELYKDARQYTIYIECWQ